MRRPGVDELLEELGPERFEDWMHFHEKHPLGDDRLRKIMAHGFLAIWMSNGGGGDLDEYDFSFEPRDATTYEQSDTEQMAIMGMHAGIMRNNAGR